MKEAEVKAEGDRTTCTKKPDVPEERLAGMITEAMRDLPSVETLKANAAILKASVILKVAAIPKAKAIPVKAKWAAEIMKAEAIAQAKAI